MKRIIYSVKDDKLLWAGLSDTTNPTSMNDLADSVAKAAADILKKQGLIA